MAKAKEEPKAGNVVEMSGSIRLKRFSVALKYHETRTVEAADEAGALKAYYDANGIIQSDHPANIQEVKDE